MKNLKIQFLEIVLLDKLSANFKKGTGTNINVSLGKYGKSFLEISD